MQVLLDHTVPGYLAPVSEEKFWYTCPFPARPLVQATSDWQHVEMILEHAVLAVVQGQEDAFVTAFNEAKSIIAGMEGFQGLTLSRCVERPGTYLLLVEWRRLQDHTEGFRDSAEYQRWRQLLHHFYDPFPVIEHYEPVLTA